MNSKRPERPKAQAKRSEARKRPSPSAGSKTAASAKDSRKREEIEQSRSELIESRRIHRAVEAEFEAAQNLGITAGEEIRRRELHTSESPILSGGDLDADWKRADVGEETVGGSVSTPDQDVVAELGEAAGIEYNDNEPLDPEEKILRRDRERWELNPASDELLREHQREQNEELAQTPKGAASIRKSASAAQKASQDGAKSGAKPSTKKAPTPFGRGTKSKSTSGKRPAQSTKPPARTGSKNPMQGKSAQRGKHR